MKQTISVVKEDKTVVSRPFDFEAMCLVDDAHSAAKRPGILRMCRPAVEYMFDGTEAGGEFIKTLDPKEMAALCLEVWDMYAGAFPAAPAQKN